MFKYVKIALVLCGFIYFINLHNAAYTSQFQLNLFHWFDKVTYFPTQKGNGWYFKNVGADGYFSGFDTEQKYQGNASAFIEGKASMVGEEGFGLLMQSFAPSKYLGKRIKLTAFLKSQNVQGHAALWGRIDTLSMRGASFDNMSDRPIQGDTAWQQYQVVLDVPLDATNFSFGFFIAGAGRVWLDEVSISEVPASEPVTGVSDKAVTPAIIEERKQKQIAYLTSVGYFDTDINSHAADLKLERADCEPKQPWHCQQELVKVSLDQTMHYRSKPSFQLQGVDSMVLSPIYQKIMATPYINKKVRVSAIVKTKDVDFTAVIWARVSDEAGNTLVHDNMANRALIGDNEWQRVSVEVNVPEHAHSITFGSMLNGLGSFWIDSFELDVLGNINKKDKVWHSYEPSNLMLEVMDE